MTLRFAPPLRAATVCVVLAGCSDMPSGWLVSSSDEPECEDCSIASSPVALLGEGLISAVPLDAVMTREGHFILLDGRSAFEFSRDGTVVHRFTVSGGDVSGTMRFSSITTVGADSLIVSDNRAGVLRIFGPGRAQVDSVRLPDNVRVESLEVLRWPDRIVFSGYALGRSGLFMAAISDGFLIIDTQFEQPPVPREIKAANYRLYHATGETFRAVEAHSYTLLEFGGDGTMSNRVVRDPDWFGKPSGGRSSGGLNSSVRAISVDGRGRLWVYSSRPTELAGPAWRSPEARRAGGTVPLGIDELYETVVEVLDRDGNALLARGSIGGYLVDVMDEGLAVFYVRGRGGAPVVSVREMRLNDRRH